MAIDLIPGKKIFTQRDVRETANIGLTPSIADFTTAQHAHTGAPSGGIVSHTSLSNIGTNTHAQIDTHIANTANPHSVVLSDLATAGEGIDFSGTDILGENASDTNKGIASFQLTDFTITAGDVFLKDTVLMTADGDVGTATTALHNLDFISGTGISTAGANNDITITNTGVTSAVAGEGIDISAATGAVTISCEDSTAGNKGIVIVNAGEGIDVTYASGTATIDGEQATATNLGIAMFPTTDFTVTNGSVTILDERICDIVGGMVTGNTETNCTVTYQDADNTLDFVVTTATDAVLGIASFNATDFTVATGAVSLANKTSYLTIAGCGFQTGVPATDNILIDGDNGVFLTVGGTTVSAACSVSVPHGAVVTGVKVIGTGTWNWYLYRDTLESTGSPTQMATAANGTEDTTITSGTIDNSLYKYWIEVYALGTDETIDSARIKYTTDYD